jgi:ribosomal protein L11 methyltransferase
MSLETLDPDSVERALVEYGALSVTLSDGGDEPLLEPAPGETPLWTDTRITALFDAGIDLDALPDHLTGALNTDQLPAYGTETLADRPWEREWLKDFGPMQFGKRLWIVPGDQPDPAGDAITVRLDPGLAFGTGTHATTALCLEWLDGLELGGKRVFDFGCGSGILGIAALKLGADSVDAIDIDLQAITATRQNAERNGVADRMAASSLLPSDDAGYDVVIANILAGTLIEQASLIVAAMADGGRVALSGILNAQADAVMAAFGDHVAFAPAATRDGWVMLSGKRN